MVSATTSRCSTRICQLSTACRWLSCSGTTAEAGLSCGRVPGANCPAAEQTGSLSTGSGQPIPAASTRHDLGRASTSSAKLVDSPVADTGTAATTTQVRHASRACNRGGRNAGIESHPVRAIDEALEVSARSPAPLRTGPSLAAGRRSRAVIYRDERRVVESLD